MENPKFGTVGFPKTELMVIPSLAGKAVGGTNLVDSTVDSIQNCPEGSVVVEYNPDSLVDLDALGPDDLGPDALGPDDLGPDDLCPGGPGGPGGLGSTYLGPIDSVVLLTVLD